MILLIDVGNTYAKWLVLKNDVVICNGKFFTASVFQEVNDLISANVEIRKIAASWVGASSAKNALQQSICDKGIQLLMAESKHEQLGLKNGYKEPRLLGVDRWLAMLGIWHRDGGPFCVIDAGTALTIDLVNASGLHLGGYIVPGYGTMVSSLNAGTSLIDCQQVNDGMLSMDVGKATSEAVGRGVLLAQVGAVQLAIESAQYHFSADKVNCYIGGGDGIQLSKWVNRECSYVDSLVLLGLKTYANAERFMTDET